MYVRPEVDGAGAAVLGRLRGAGAQEHHLRIILCRRQLRNALWHLLLSAILLLLLLLAILLRGLHAAWQLG